MDNGRPVSGDGSVAFAWAGETRTFNIGKIKSLRELQAACDAGPMEILMRLQTGAWRVDDYREVIRIGLLGGGMHQADVARLMKFHVDEAAPLPNIVAAKAILSCGLSWPADDTVGKPQAEKNPTEASEGASSSPQSTESGPQSVSLQDKPTSLPSGNLPPASTDTTLPTAETTNPRP